jgi:hypothetical protein
MFPGWSGGRDIYYQLTVRAFSRYNIPIDDDSVPHVRCQRQTGKFPTLHPDDDYDEFFSECRMSALCRWSGHVDARSFTIVLLGDFPSVQREALVPNVLFTDWSGRGFTVGGGNAGYHMLQSVMHRVLMFWEMEWSDCLRSLSDGLNTTVKPHQ